MGAHKRVLPGNADAVEFCSTPAYHNLLAAASYTLVEGPTPTRVGGVYLFALGDGDGDDTNLHELQTIETSGVFDIKWRRPSDGALPCLGQASADGSLRLYTLQDDENKPVLQESSNLDIGSSMCLSLDWSPASSEIAVSHSSGALTILDLGESSPRVIHSGEAHELETWVASFDSWHPRTVYTGADDCHFCAWDTRAGLDAPVFRNKRTHSMGVTSVQSNPKVEHEVISGSYDEKLRVWDMRVGGGGGKGVVSEVGLGGGVWRVKWHPLEVGVVACACMHAGFSVVRVLGGDGGGFGGVEVVEEYKGHESLGYGVDWYQGVWGKGGGEKGVGSLVATCSFYDQALHVWEPSLGASYTKT